ncbi:MAG: MotA/TolQ/ExbB proton channel family protein [Bryobacteraceae bacterium]
MSQSETPSRGPRGSRRHFDICLLAGIAIAAGSAIAGIRSTGINPAYFLQPTGAFIVLGGSLGVMLITTPGHSLIHSFRRIFQLFSPASGGTEALVEEIVRCARVSRRDGPAGLEALAAKAGDPFLRDALTLACDVNDRGQLQGTLETALRMRERQGEVDAKTFEVAGGFAPTIGIMGTVVGLIEVMRQFSSMQSVGYGIGTAFVSTIYGLALANLVMLPIAHRIRARVAEAAETQELIVEGVVCIADGVHPALIRARLRSFLRTGDDTPRNTLAQPNELAAGSGARGVSA